MSALTLDSEVSLHPRVSIRPEPFGALLYHFGTRKLSFLKSPRLLAVVNGLLSPTSVREALTEAGVSDAETSTYLRALSALHDSQMLVEAP